MAEPMVDDAGNVWLVDGFDANGQPINPRPAPATSSAGRVFNLPPDPAKVRAEARADAAAARADANSGRSAAAAERAADAAVTTAGNKNIDNAMSLQGKFDGQPTVKEYRSLVANLATGLETEDNPTGDNALIYAYAKVMDPASVVRESEMDMAASGDSKIQRAYERFKKETGYDKAGQLSQVTRDRLRREMLNKGKQYNRLYSLQRNRFIENAQRIGVEPELVVGPHDGDAFRPVVEGYQKRMGLDEYSNQAQQQADNEVPDPTTGAALKDTGVDNSPGDLPPANGNLALPEGGRRIVRDPRVSSMVDSMINAGAGEATINVALKKAGFPTINRADLLRARSWMKENPGKRYYGSDPTRVESLGLGQQILANPSVAPLAAGLAHYANTATAGTVGALSGEEGKGALDAAAALNPGSTLAGSLAGGVTGALGAEAALAARAPAALVQYAPRVADALYGGALGFNTAQKGEGGMGALQGAGAGLLGGYLGQKALSGVGRSVRGVRDANVGYLQGQGVPLTVGQAVGGSGRVGGTIKNIEDALTSIPGVGGIVNARRTEGLEAFNQAAMRQAGAPAGIPVTASGSQGMEQLRQGIGPAYDNALGGAQIDANNPAFLAEVQNLVDASNAIPPVGGAREAAAAAIENRIGGAVDPDTGIMSGRNFQEAYRGLGRTARERAAGDYGHEVGQVMRQGQNTLADALDAQNPGALAAFRNANSVNRNANIIAQALDRAKNQGDELFTPAQINTADAMAARRLEGPMASAAGDRPFFDLARAGQEVLPSKLPDSGTATRGLVGAGLVGGLGGAGLGAALGDPGSGAQAGLGATLLLAAGGNRAAQAAMVRALTQRSPAAIRVGDNLVANQRHGGWTGAGLLAPLFVGQ